MARPKTPSPSYHHGDLKRALIETSIELLAEGGLAALSVAEAGRRIGVSSAAPYKHFRDHKDLLRAVAAEGNRRMNEYLLAKASGETDPARAFALSGVGYVEWAAQNPALYLIILDPSNTDFDATEPGDLDIPEALDSMPTFWTDLAKRVRSGRALNLEDPLIQELAGRALAHGLASLFVSGTFASLGIHDREAGRLMRAVTGLEPEGKPLKEARKKRRIKDC